jgi:hypothetical protein
LDSFFVAPGCATGEYCLIVAADARGKLGGKQIGIFQAQCLRHLFANELCPGSIAGDVPALQIFCEDDIVY